MQAHQLCPPSMVESEVEHEFLLSSHSGSQDKTLEKAWHWLMLKSTFSDGQLWPFVVEFLPATDEPFFRQGELTNHFGPWLNASGIVSAVTKQEYRRLDYFYGSYVGSFRIFRPVCLEFSLKRTSDGILITLSFKYYVKPILSRISQKTLAYFWQRFERWMRASIEKD